MASEPKKPIEQMLEALAKARRAEFGDDPKMPNPMRARLHEEIARARGSEEQDAESRPSWITMFWPRLTVAAALATLIVLVPAIWWNQSHPVGQSGDLALRGRSAEAADEFKAAMPTQDTLAKSSAVHATEPTVNLADNSQIKIEPTDAMPSSISKEIATAKIQSAPAAAPVIGGDAVAQRSTNQQSAKQPSIQSFRNNAQVNRAANVLNKFQVQQEGSEIRVIDADGSTYTGKIEEPSKTAEVDSRLSAQGYAAKPARKDAAHAAGETESADSRSHFRATGFNVSLKRKVVFEGNYDAPAAQGPAAATSDYKKRAESSGDRPRIVGTVRVNGEAPVEVDAIAEIAEPTATENK